MDPSILLETLGFTAGLIGLLAWIPQVIEVWYHKRHQGVSLPTLFSIITAMTLWTIYGIILNATAMAISNGITLLFILSVAIGIMRLRWDERKTSTSNVRKGQIIEYRMDKRLQYIPILYFVMWAINFWLMASFIHAPSQSSALSGLFFGSCLLLWPYVFHRVLKDPDIMNLSFKECLFYKRDEINMSHECSTGILFGCWFALSMWSGIFADGILSTVFWSSMGINSVYYFLCGMFLKV